MNDTQPETPPMKSRVRKRFLIIGFVVAVFGLWTIVEECEWCRGGGIPIVDLFRVYPDSPDSIAVFDYIQYIRGPNGYEAYCDACFMGYIRYGLRKTVLVFE